MKRKNESEKRVKLTKTTTIELQQLHRVDHRSGFQKLRDIIFDLRDKGYREGESIPYEDIEDSIFENCGIDHRTVRKYLQILVKRHYLRPVGHILRKRTRISVTTYSRVDASPQHNPKEYSSCKGYSAYVFGLRAPKRFSQEQLPSTTPLSEFNERSVNMENMCVRVSRGQGESTEQESEAVEQVRRIEEREITVAHTHNLSKQRPKRLNKEELWILRASAEVPKE